MWLYLAGFVIGGEGQTRNILKIGNHGRRNYTRILNETFCNKRLGIEARGILSHLITKPIDWKPRVWALAKEFGCSKPKIRKGLKNLAAEGYARMIKVGGGYRKAFGWQWQVRESPELLWPDEVCLHNSSSRNSNDEFSNDGKVARIQTNQLHKQKSSTKERDKGKGAPTRRARFDFVPKYPYPKSPEEGYVTLEAEGYEIDPDYDGNFFQDMIDHDWMIDGEPVYDWKATYVARIEKIHADRGD